MREVQGVAASQAGSGAPPSAARSLPPRIASASDSESSILFIGTAQPLPCSTHLHHRRAVMVADSGPLLVPRPPRTQCFGTRAEPGNQSQNQQQPEACNGEYPTLFAAMLSHGSALPVKLDPSSHGERTIRPTNTIGANRAGPATTIASLGRNRQCPGGAIDKAGRHCQRRTPRES